jgi:hypothetical protein
MAAGVSDSNFPRYSFNFPLSSFNPTMNPFNLPMNSPLKVTTAMQAVTQSELLR